MGVEGGEAERETILIVEDDPGCREVNRRRIENSYAVQTSESGSKAIEALDEDIDVVLLDRRLPDMTGQEVLETIHETQEQCRVIMYTGVDPEPDGTCAGADAYLVNPTTGEELLNTIEDVL